MMMGLAIGCWLVSRYIPPTGSAAPGPRHRQEHIALDLAPGQRAQRQAAHLARRADDVLVLDGRRHHPVHPADAGRRTIARRRRDRRHRLSRGVRRRHRHRLGHRRLDVAGPHGAAARAGRHGADGVVRARSRLDDLGHAGRGPGRDARRLLCRPEHHSCRHRPRRHGDRRRLSRRADLRRRAGLGAGGSPRPRRRRA